MPVGAHRFRRANHGQDRSDSDTAGDELVVGRRIEREMIPGPAHGDGRSFVELVVCVGGSAASGGIPEDADSVPVAVVRIAAQRVLPHEFGRENQVDVCARLPLR
mgnify:CR=1 FL=1